MSDVAEKKRVTFAEMRIRVWSPVDERDPYIAKIGSLNMLFYGATPFQATMKADKWRKEELAKLHKRGSRQNDRIPEPDPLAPGDE